MAIDRNAAIASLRIVTADHYMHEPLAELDPCYSEYRGSSVIKVPVIRIFGTDTAGTKTCMHVHGVFPYLYIPYHGVNPKECDRFTYQVAASLDKALNISLGQMNGSAEHVFKIVHVKGIPFYGYHPTEHQYLKIYLYNPMMIKRASSLFQNGAIMGKIFQPHESHVPYVLQFLIDYNLYGMSFLYVPSEVVRYRLSSNECVADVEENMFLKNAERTSTSKRECDIPAAFILNRLDLNKVKSKTDHENPGIASIWRDEVARRGKMDNSPSPPEVPLPEDRPEAQPTESDRFYREALITKIRQLRELNESMLDSNETISSASAIPSSADSKKTFNLKQFLSNSVYPAECSANENVLNASHVLVHTSQSVDSLSVTLKSRNTTAWQQDTVLDETIVNEDIIFSLSQKYTSLDETLNEEEFELLEIMRKLETHDDNVERDVDEDSLLAPLSQVVADRTQQLSQRSNVGANSNASVVVNGDAMAEGNAEDEATSKYFMDSDDDLLNDFSLCMEEEIGEFRKESIVIDQLDGASDDVNTPKKIRNKFAPLNVVHCRSPKRDGMDKIIEFLKNKKEVQLMPIAKKPKLALTSTATKKTAQPKTSIIDLTQSDEEDTVPESQSRDLNFITCHLKKRALATNEKPGATLVMETVDDHAIVLTTPPTTPVPNDPLAFNSSTPIAAKRRRSSSDLPANFENMTLKLPLVKLKKYANIEIDCPTVNSSAEAASSVEPTTKPVKRYPTRVRTNQFKQVVEKRILTSPNGKEKKERKKPLTLEQCRNWSTCEVARRYDKLHDFIPEAGPSTVNFYYSLNIPGYYYPLTADVDRTPLSTTSNANRSSPIETNGPCEVDPLDWNPINIQSFYGDTSALLDTPRATRNASPIDTNNMNNGDTEIRTPVMRNLKNRFRGTASPLTQFDEPIVITALLRPPTFDEVLSNMFDYNIPIDRLTEPFYGNEDDVTTRKEVGNTILNIQPLHNVPNFQSNVLTMGDFSSHAAGGLNMWRANIFHSATGVKKSKNVQTVGIEDMRDFLSTEEPCVIGSVVRPPTALECARWVKSMRRHQMASNTATPEAMGYNHLEDSPIRVRRERAKVTLNGASETTNGIDDDDVIDCDISLSPSPLGTAPKVSSMNDDDTIPSSQSPVTCVNVSEWRRKVRASLSLNSRFETARKDGTRNATSPNVFAGTSKKINGAAKKRPPIHTNGRHHHHDSSESEDVIICLDDKDDCVALPCSQLFNGGPPNTTIDLATQNWQSASFVTNFNLDVSGYRSFGSGDHSFGISGATLENSYGFKMDLENFQLANATLEHDYLTIMSLEIHVQTRGNLRPDPEHDAIGCVFYRIQNNVPAENIDCIPTTIVGLIVVGGDANAMLAATRLRPIIGYDVHVEYVNSEKNVLLKLVTLVSRWDPDIFTGYEIEMASWGYVLQRGQALDINLASMFSRIPAQKMQPTWREDDGGGDDGNSVEFEVKLIGRIFLNVWRLLRGEIALTSYTFESVMYHIIHRRCPVHGHRELSRMWTQSLTQWIVLEYYLERVSGTMELLGQLDLIGRTCELAKLFGIQFYEVLSRGSQFRVESMMLRIAKPKNVIPVSPSVQQRAHMRSPEYLPLILEPLSRLYTEPLIVLDFQSLYPSMIIAYNYCFSTCLGRVEHLGHTTPFEFGASQLRVSPSLLNKLIAKDLITVSPCGAVFVKSSVREGVLPRMLREILDTRLMVKQSMKMHKADKMLQRVLHSRQLGLKLMANVTYGYTAANFSGRMPCVEVGDSVVSKGRETLERAIKLVEATSKWRAKVVYGDTDSLFVLVPGRSRDDAFRIGAEIADAVTKDNPHPVKLKLEKVYHPSLLQTKKRYVGYMYESPDQLTPTYEAKGIETVRRDGCPAVAKMLEKTLKILFETRNVSIIKSYVCRQFTKILSGRANIQDLIFAKEFRGIKGYKPGACVPALELTRKWRQQDRRAEPRRGERVPYLVVNGPPGVPLIRLVRSPHDFLADPGLKINAIYYITKAIIPPLNRCLLLIGADVFVWFADLPRKVIQLPTVSIASHLIGSVKGSTAKKSTISQYFSTTGCAADCGAQTQSGVCSECCSAPDRASVALAVKMRSLDRKYVQLTRVCQSCCGRQTDIACRSLDCPVVFVLNDCRRAHVQTQYYRELLDTKFV